MQLKVPFAIAIYLGSYLPLSVILLVQDVDGKAVERGICPLSSMIDLQCASPLRNPAWSLSAVLVCVLGLLATFAALRRVPTPNNVTVTESKHIPADLINYVIPYVVSFISLEYDQTQKLFGFGVFLAWIFWITYKSGQIALNPVLAVFGWKLFEVKYIYRDSKRIFVGRVLSKVDIEPDRSYRRGNLQDVMVIRTDGEGAGE